MKIKICVIGVEDSIELAKKVSTEFENIVDFVFYSYSLVSDIIDFISQTPDINVIMFTGRYPYKFFKQNAYFDIPFFSISKSNETLIETFWKIRNENIDFEKVSIDRSPISEVIEILEGMEIPKNRVKLIGDSSEISLDEIYEFHKVNYDEGKVEAIISSNYKIYNRLKDEGYRVYRILPSKFLLHESIKKAISMASTEKMKISQVAVQTIRVREMKDEGLSKYNQLKLINKFDDILIDYTNEIQGSYFKFGNNEFMIFTTRGFIGIGDIERSIGMLVERSEKLNLSFAMGIGYGDSIMNSEKNSRIALKHAMQIDKSGCYIVDDDASIAGPIFGKNSYNLSYSLVNTDEVLKRISSETGVSEKYLSKVKAIISQRNDDTFHAEELGEYLNISQRSALRILNKLDLGGIAEHIGTSSNNTKGRPKKIFKIDLSK